MHCQPCPQKDFAMKIGAKIADNRQQMGLSQLELAKMLRVSEQTVILWEEDKAFPALSKLRLLGKLFNLTVNQFLGDDSPIPIESSCSDSKDCAFSVTTTITEDSLQRVFTLLTQKAKVGFLVLGIIFAVATVLFYLLEEDLAIATLVAAIFMLYFSFSLNTSKKNSVKQSLTLSPNEVLQYYFFDDFAIVKIYSDNSRITRIVNYSQITKLLQDDKYLFFIYQNTIYSIEKVACGQNYDRVVKLIKPASKNNKNNTIQFKR